MKWELRKVWGNRVLLILALWGFLAWVGCVVAEVVTTKVHSPLPAALICVLLLPGLALIFPL